MATPNERSIPESRAKMSFSLRDSSVLRRSRLNASESTQKARDRSHDPELRPARSPSPAGRGRVSVPSRAPREGTSVSRAFFPAASGNRNEALSPRIREFTSGIDERTIRVSVGAPPESTVELEHDLADERNSERTFERRKPARVERNRNELARRLLGEAGVTATHEEERERPKGFVQFSSVLGVLEIAEVRHVLARGELEIAASENVGLSEPELDCRDRRPSPSHRLERGASAAFAANVPRSRNSFRSKLSSRLRLRFERTKRAVVPST